MNLAKPIGRLSREQVADLELEKYEKDHKIVLLKNDYFFVGPEPEELNKYVVFRITNYIHRNNITFLDLVG